MNTCIEPDGDPDADRPGLCTSEWVECCLMYATQEEGEDPGEDPYAILEDEEIYWVSDCDTCGENWCNGQFFYVSTCVQCGRNWCVRGEWDRNSADVESFYRSSGMSLADHGCNQVDSLEIRAQQRHG